MTTPNHAFIFARGGSKGLPRKNLRLISGVPLIGHSILCAQKIGSISKIFLSTDCKEIAEVGQTFNAEIINRPVELASDTSPEWLSWQHAVSYVEEKYGEFDKFLSLPPTAPCRRSEDVLACIEALDDCVDIVVTATQSARNPWFNMIQELPSGHVRRVNIDSNFNRRQDCPQCLDLATVAYATRASFIRDSSSIWDGKMKAVEVPTESAIDIDSYFDYSVAKFVLEQFLVHSENKHLPA